MKNIVYHVTESIVQNLFLGEFSTNKMFLTLIHFVLIVRNLKAEFYAHLTIAITVLGFSTHITVI